MLPSISRAEVNAFDARQVVETVAVLDGLHLVLEDEVEGGAQQAAEQVLLLGQAADPQVDRVEAGDRAGAPLRVHRQRVVDVVGVRTQAVHEVIGVLAEARGGLPNRRHLATSVERGRPLVDQRRRADDAGMRAVGRHEVDQRAGVLEELAELVPAGVGLHRRVLGAAGIELGEDLVAHQVERRHAGVAAAREVDGGQVERQAEQIVPQARR